MLSLTDARRTYLRVDQPASAGSHGSQITWTDIGHSHPAIGMGDEAPRPWPSSVRDREASVDQFTGPCRRRSGKPLSRKRFATTPIDREIGQQDLDERSKHLTERGPFVNGARSNLAAAHGRGLHPTGAPINIAVSRFA